MRWDLLEFVFELWSQVRYNSVCALVALFLLGLPVGLNLVRTGSWCRACSYAIRCKHLLL